MSTEEIDHKRKASQKEARYLVKRLQECSKKYLVRSKLEVHPYTEWMDEDLKNRYRSLDILKPFTEESKVTKVYFFQKDTKK